MLEINFVHFRDVGDENVWKFGDLLPHSDLRMNIYATPPDISTLEPAYSGIIDLKYEIYVYI